MARSWVLLVEDTAESVFLLQKPPWKLVARGRHKFQQKYHREAKRLGDVGGVPGQPREGQGAKV